MKEKTFSPEQKEFAVDLYLQDSAAFLNGGASPSIILALAEEEAETAFAMPEGSEKEALLERIKKLRAIASRQETQH